MQIQIFGLTVPLRWTLGWWKASDRQSTSPSCLVGSLYCISVDKWSGLFSVCTGSGHYLQHVISDSFACHCFIFWWSQRGVSIYRERDKMPENLDGKIRLRKEEEKEISEGAARSHWCQLQSQIPSLMMESNVV